MVTSFFRRLSNFFYLLFSGIHSRKQAWSISGKWERDREHYEKIARMAALLPPPNPKVDADIAKMMSEVHLKNYKKINK